VTFRPGLLWEILRISVDTLRANKLRSALTILGVVIGVMSIVAMTSLIGGFSDQIRTQINQLGANTVYLEKAGFESFSSGRDFMELLKRPNLNEGDAAAIAASPLVARLDVQAGDFGGPWSQQVRVTYASQATKRLPLVGTSANFPDTNSIEISQGRYFAEFEVQNKHAVAVLGFTVADTLFPASDPIGKVVRMDGKAYTVVGVFGKRPSPLGDANSFVTVPWTTYEKRYDPWRFRGYLWRPFTIVVSGVDGVTQAALKEEIGQIMRARHRLRMDEPDDFDMMTADSVLKFLEQFTRAIVLALVVISSIALMVGGIGVMAIMTISVTERTREIGVRKALGARRREILVQFLIEAVFLTSLGGLLGIALGAGIGYAVNIFAGFPVALPLWSFGLGVGFSATVGILFGMLPAVKAAKLDPIEALRYE
jgi:putative ABC transport system permease protein